MQVIPVINCPDAACATGKLARLSVFYPTAGFVHLDVTDGIFSTHHAWFNVAAWEALSSPFALEAHLMVQKPEEFVGQWAACAKRLIVPVESLSRETAEAIRDMAQRHGVTMMLSENPETPPEAFQPYFDLFAAFQILAVHPGPPGQDFMPVALEKIATLRRLKPDAIIEVDGGINVTTARQVKAAGADIVTSGSYILEAEDPKKAYEELKNI